MLLEMIFLSRSSYIALIVANSYGSYIDTCIMLLDVTRGVLQMFSE